MRRLATIALCATLVAGCNRDEPKSAAPSVEKAKKALAGAPAPLAAIHAQSNDLLPGGADALTRRIADLKGHPIVINKWGSWCDPCRREFPAFQRQSIERGKEVAFLGVNGADNEGAAKRFLEKFPVAFPSYSDPGEKLASVIKAAGPYPQTVFYDRAGEVTHMKAGPYRDEKDLATDIERYAR